ncbi:hypothetical protein [Hyphomicrobium sp. ghe19]|uniref:hypothetical protein n=1 Tax=Hyphomicrobium sp. ghe19 TaxID=2682968 RepID=UPI001366842D|nr:hypothetical protein HYPP_00810 [Hyphomicrobium sp. ghe19]
MPVRRPSIVVPALLSIAALTGCAGNAPELQSQLQSLSIQPTSETTPTVAALPGEPQGGKLIPGATGSATEIYSRLARGAMTCWFPVGGPLKKDYVFHATADAPSRGGKAEIVIHERDPSQPNPRGPKAFLIAILPTGDASANLTAENRKMPNAFAAAMTDDISRWAKGTDGCATTSPTPGWIPAPPETANAAQPAKKSKDQKTKLKAAQAKPAQQP